MILFLLLFFSFCATQSMEFTWQTPTMTHHLTLSNTGIAYSNTEAHQPPVNPPYGHSKPASTNPEQAHIPQRENGFSAMMKDLDAALRPLNKQLKTLDFFKGFSGRQRTYISMGCLGGAALLGSYLLITIFRSGTHS